MKRATGTMIALFFFLIASALCYAGADDNDTAALTAPIVERISFSILGNESIAQVEDEALAPRAGYIFFAFLVEITNGSEASIFIGSTDRHETFGISIGGMKIPASNTNTDAWRNERPVLNMDYLAPGETATGWVCFEIPLHARPEVLFFKVARQTGLHRVTEEGELSLRLGD